MTEATTVTRYAIFLKVGPNDLGARETDGWRTLVDSGDAAILAQFLRRQAPLLSHVGGFGVLARIASDDDGTDIKALMDHVGKMRPDAAYTRIPRALKTADRTAWCNLVETFLAERVQAEAVATVSSTGRKAILPTMEDVFRLLRPLRSRGAAYATASMVGVGAIVGIWSASSPVRDYRIQAQVPMTYGEDLAEGGSVRRLQGVAQAFGRRW